MANNKVNSKKVSTNVTPYLIPASSIEVETVVNRSRFICAIEHCDNNAAVKSFIEQKRLQYPDASHHCYAFISDRPENSQAYGFSDDGEPSGTAGKPMLAAVQGSNIGEICAVVTRYFGGTKLGTGGLQRAYGLSVREAIDLLPTTLKTPTEQVSLHCDHQQVKDIEHAIKLSNGEVVSQDYGIDVVMVISLPIVDVDSFCDRVTKLTAARVSVKRDNTNTIKE